MGRTKEQATEYNKNYYRNLTPEKRKEFCKKLYANRKRWMEKPENRAKAYAYTKKKLDNQARTRARKARWIDEYKLTLGGCVDCGFNKWPEALDFDHIDPKTKSFIISKEATSISKEKLLMEIAKCELRCSNCHRHKHRLERLKYEYASSGISSMTVINTEDKRLKYGVL